MLRISRLLAVARYEMRCHMTGRQALRLLGVASALLLPAGLIPTPRFRPPATTPVAVVEGIDAESFVGPPPPPKVRVRGSVPPSLAHRLELVERAPVEVRGENPVIVRAPEVTMELRGALETLEGPKQLEYRSFLIPGRLPGRSLLIAILAISLLTGPLADALPGERARRTLEVLLTAGITRGELIGGKWFAWTMSASLTAMISAGLAVWQGVQQPGWWLAALPLFVGSAVAFGLWLVRLVDDVVGGSAAPMRVLPVAAGAMAALARGMSETSPVLAAAVPLGGPLLVAADIFSTQEQFLAALAGTAVFIVAILTRTGRELDRMDAGAAPNRWGAAGLCAVAILLWWLTVAGPGVWSAGPAGATSNLVTPIGRSMLVGGIALLACAAIAVAREARRGPAARAARRPWPLLIGVTAAVSAALAASGPLPALESASNFLALDAMLERLRVSAVPLAMTASLAAALAALLSILGQVVLFRSVAATRLGWILASLLWCIAMSPTAPWTTLPASFALGALGAAFGWVAALVAQLSWSFGASTFAMDGGAMRTFAFQSIALVIAFVAFRVARGEPSRHQL